MTIGLWRNGVRIRSVRSQISRCAITMLKRGRAMERHPMTTFLPGQGAFCDWEHLGAGVSCSQYRADPVNVCPGMP